MCVWQKIVCICFCPADCDFFLALLIWGYLFGRGKKYFGSKLLFWSDLMTFFSPDIGRLAAILYNTLWSDKLGFVICKDNSLTLHRLRNNWNYS